MKINNRFFDLIVYFLSLFFSFYRSLLLLFGFKNNVKKGIFFESMDFIFRVWPSYFWKKPNLFKIGSFLSYFLKYLFYNNKK